jgi:serine/threonine protein kinase
MVDLGCGTYGKAIKKDNTAVKIFKDFDIFLNEYQMMKMLDDHPNIIKIFSYNRIDKSITMELGKYSLYYYIHSIPSIESSIESKQIIDNMISAVYYLHQNNIAHLDISPENFVVFEDCVKIIDFSTSIRTDLFLEKEKEEDDLVSMEYGIPHILCRINYRPPELTCGLNNYYPALVDVWSLGCVIYEVLFEETLFRNFLLDNNENFILARLIVQKIGNYPKLYSEKFGNLSRFSNFYHKKSYEDTLENTLKDNKYAELLKKMLVIFAPDRYNMDKIYKINQNIK